MQTPAVKRVNSIIIQIGNSGNFIDYEYSLLFLKSSARGTQNILCKLGKETRREWVIEMGNVKRARKRKRLLAI